MAHTSGKYTTTQMTKKSSKLSKMVMQVLFFNETFPTRSFVQFNENDILIRQGNNTTPSLKSTKQLHKNRRQSMGLSNFIKIHE